MLQPLNIRSVNDIEFYAPQMNRQQAQTAQNVSAIATGIPQDMLRPPDFRSDLSGYKTLTSESP